MTSPAMRPVGWLKRLEILAKHLLAIVGALLLFRRFDRAYAASVLARPRKVLLVRVDDRVGEALLMTPLFSALRRKGDIEVHALVHGRCARVLEGHPDVDRVVAFDRRRLWLGPLAPGVRAVRARGYDVVVNCANWEVPSITQALVSRLVAPRAIVVGPSMWPVRWLTDLPVQPRSDTRSELAQRQHLLTPLGAGEPLERVSFRPVRVRQELERFVDGVRHSPHAVVNPGGRLDWRRVPPSVFAAACRALMRHGRTPVVTWGPREEGLANEVAALAPGAIVAPPTDLDELAALMQAAGLTVCNNTGPMHLSVAVGVPTIALFLHMPVERWGYAHAPHRMLDLTPLAGSVDEMARRVEAEIARALSSARAG